VINERTLMLGGGAALVVLVLGALWIRSRGGVSGAAQAVGEAAVDAAAGVASGAVSGASRVVGLPTPSETVTDARQARWLIDNAGTMQATKWASAGALMGAVTLPAGSGVRPGDSTPAGRAFAGIVTVTDTGDELARLKRRFGVNGTGGDAVYGGAILWSPEELG